MKKKRNKLKNLLLALSLIVSVSTFTSDIKIVIIDESKGLELGTDSRARGKGSIATGRKSIAIGQDAVATGGDNNKESIVKKLEENKLRVKEITDLEDKQKENINNLTTLRVKEKEVIDAALRVEQMRKQKEIARLDWQDKLNKYNTLKDESVEYFKKHQNKIDDLNSRLVGVSNLESKDISTPDGLEKTVTEFKKLVEKDTTLNLSLDFYKDYVNSYYKALGDLRENEILRRKMDPNNFLSEYTGNGLPKNGLVSKYYDLQYLIELKAGYYNNKDTINFKSNIITLSLTSTKFLNIKDINTEIINHVEYNEAKDTGNLLKTNFRKYFNKNNDMFLTKDIKEKMYKINDFKIDYRLKTYEITYYQGEYEKTRNTTWLDKKNVALKELANMEKTYYEYINKNENGVYVNNPYVLKALNIQRWQKENIDDIKEKNKITVETLTNELEKVLGVNKNAVLERKAELEKLKTSIDNAENTYNNLNPNPDDIKLSEEYEKIKSELDKLNEEILLTDARIKALKEALTLNDLTNIGENQIAYGTEALAVGNDTIAIGTKASSIGNASISIGKESTTIGDNSTTIGYKSVNVGNENKVLGNLNLVYGNNNTVLGNNNKVGLEDSKQSNNIFLGNNIVANVSNAIVLGDNSTAVENSISVGSKNTQRQIKFVKEGTENTDAVNLKQLKDYVASKITNSNNVDLNNYYNKTQIDEKIKAIKLPQFNVDGVIAAEGDKVNNAVSGKTVYEYLEENNKKVSNMFKDELISVGKKINETGASSSAMANLPQSDKENMIFAAVGQQGSSVAIALGLSGANKKCNVVYKVSGAINNSGQISLGAGLGYKFGVKEDNVIKENEVLKNKLQALEDKVNKLLENK